MEGLFELEMLINYREVDKCADIAYNVFVYVRMPRKLGISNELELMMKGAHLNAASKLVK